MKRFLNLGLAVVVAASLVACGGGGDDDKPTFTSLVSFGDSLSDVGSYQVSTIAAVGGGKYTVNGPDSKNWTELLAATIGVKAPCAAQTGLNSIIPGIPKVPVDDHEDEGCHNYAQGGARVTEAVGPWNIGSAPDPRYVLGQLTVPVKTQIENHLTASGGKFSGSELVTVMVGANDLDMNLAKVGAGLQTPDQALAAMALAGAETAAYVKGLIVAKGAQHVVVLNVPDVSKTPYAVAAAAKLGPVAGADLLRLIAGMASTYNLYLATGLVGVDEVLVVDAYGALGEWVANPAKFGISNATQPACNLAVTILPTSLVCTNATLAAADVSAFLFADTVHPAPFGYKLFADQVAAKMASRRWL